MVETQKMQHSVDDKQGQLSLLSRWVGAGLPHCLRVGDDDLAQRLWLLEWQDERHVIGRWRWFSFPLPVALVEWGKGEHVGHLVQATIFSVKALEGIVVSYHQA